MSSYTADRQGHVYKNDSGQDRLLEKMYGCAPGRAVLKPLVNPVLSELGGRILDSRLSALAVPAFIRQPESTCGIMKRKSSGHTMTFLQEGSARVRGRSVWYRSIL